MSVQEVEWKIYIIDIVVMKIFISNTVVGVYTSGGGAFKENLYRVGGLLTLGAPLLLHLLNVSLNPLLIQCNHRTPSAQLRWIKIIYIEGWYKQNNMDHHIVINQLSYPPPNVTKPSDIFLIPVNDERVQHISLINKSGIQYILS